jgi:riboflavin kinase/FMN adenylyltransferase
VVTLGVFDGVHLGHQAVLAETVRWAREEKGTPCVLTFDRHPEIVLRNQPPAAITSIEHRLALIEKSGIAVAFVLHFDAEIAAMSAQDFVRDILADRLGVVGVLLGFNARFGKDALGDFDLLVRLSRKYGFEARRTEACLVGGTPVSSTLIRNLITTGDLEQASRLLGRPVTLRGTVTHGDHRGRTLGFPTANLNLHHEVTPPRGVYIGRVRVDSDRYWGLVNVGFRPTFERPGSPARLTVETYIDALPAGTSLYGRTIEVEILRHVRGERKFESAEALVAQMEKDRRLLHAVRDSAPTNS